MLGFEFFAFFLLTFDFYLLSGMVWFEINEEGKTYG